MAFDGYCPDCKLYGDDCPLRRSEEEALQATNVFSSALVGCVLRYLKFSNKAMGEKGVNAFGSLLRSQNTLEEPYLINVVGLNMYHNMREWHRDVINKVKQLNEIYALHTRRMPPRLMHYELSGGKLKHCASRRLVILVDETYATKTNALEAVMHAPVHFQGSLTFVCNRYQLLILAVMYTADEDLESISNVQ